MGYQWERVIHPLPKWGIWKILQQEHVMSCGPTSLAMTLSWQINETIAPQTLTVLAKKSGGYKLSTFDRPSVIKVLEEPNVFVGGIFNAAGLRLVADEFCNHLGSCRVDTWDTTPFWPSMDSLKTMMDHVPEDPKKNGRTDCSVIIALTDPGHYMAIHSRKSKFLHPTEWYIADPGDGTWLCAKLEKKKWAAIPLELQDNMKSFGALPRSPNFEYPWLTAWKPGSPKMPTYETVVGESVLVKFKLL